MFMNAIILAGGCSTRLYPLTKSTPKSLLLFNNKPLIEYTIEYLKEKGINDINIITGFCGDQFEYLKDKYGCHLINNPYYKKFNNIYSLLLASDKLNDSFVIDSDVCLLDNIFQKHNKSTYYTVVRENTNNEWALRRLEDRIIGFDITNESRPTLFGISYYINSDAKILRDNLKKISISDLENPHLYYDNVVFDSLNDIYMIETKIDSDKVDEIDNINDYKRVAKKFENKQLSKRKYF